jgi:ankyrin repeat protein
LYSQTDIQQRSLLQRPENRKIIQKVIDDTSTLRATILGSHSSPPTIVSHPESTIDGAIFDVDTEIVNTAPYRRAMEHNVSKRSGGTPNRSASDATNPFRRIPLTLVTHVESTADHGFYDQDADIVNPDAYRQAMAEGKSNEKPNLWHRSVSDSAQHKHRTMAQPGRTSDSALGSLEPKESKHQLSPMERFRSETWQKPRPYRIDSPDFFAGDREGDPPRRHMSSASDSRIPQQISLPTPEVKKSLWGSIKKMPGRAGLTPPGQQRTASSPTGSPGPSLGTRRVKRRGELNIHMSIDFGSSEGLSAPAIVRAAQSGSRMEIELLLEQRADIEECHEGSGRTALAVASHCGNDDVVFSLLRHGARVNILDALSMTPLHLAASRGHYRVLRYLIDGHADVDALGPDNQTPLRLAADNGHFDAAELLLQCQAKVNARDRRNLTALHAAAKIGDDTIVSLLLRYGADFEAKDGELMTALHYACEENSEAVVEALLAHRADIEAQGKEAMTPLLCACRAGARQVTSILLVRKANLKHKGEGNMTSLHWACYNGHAEVADLLLQKKCSIEARTSDGRTPLHIATMTKNFAVAELLVRKGAALEAQCNRSLRPIHYACQNADPILVQLLLSSGAQIEAATQLDLLRPLHMATIRDSSTVAEMLLKKGATVDARNATGDRALSLACTLGHIDLVRLLLSKGAAMRARAPKGPSREDSPLCKAAAHGHLPVVLELLDKGASIRETNEANWQPLRCAAFYGHADIVDALLKRGASVVSLDSTDDGDLRTTTSKLGFAPGVNQRCRKAVLELLNSAETKERTEPQRLSEDDPYLTTLKSGMRQDATRFFEMET